ncbi:MAG: fused response regulator/phosphatase [Campylobacterales bacterium]|nr:fused response regulator/phosphatase [Campylobacterales bacterium]
MDKKILVVEDSKLFLALLDKNIKKLDGFTPYLADSFAAAEKLLAEHEFFAAILDMVLPDASNGEIVDLVTDRNIPAVVLTGNDSEEFREKIADKPLIDYVVKRGLNDVVYATSLIEKILKNRSVKVLVVDDSKISRRVVVKAIQQHHFIIYEAEDGVQALEILDEHPDIKLVFTDYHMPNMDGFEFLKNVRKKFSKDHMAVIVISSEQEGDVSSRFLKNGANDFIKKPFTKEEFIGRMYQNLEIIELVEETNKQKDEITELHEYAVEEQNKAYNKQKGLVTNDLKEDPDWKDYILYRSSDILCGDLYSIHKQKDGSIFLYLLDGMGHGIQPSLTVFAATTILKQAVNVVDNLDELLGKLLESLKGILAEEEQLSYTVFHISADRKKLRYVNGGMYPTYVMDGAKMVELKANNLPIMPWSMPLKPTEVEISDFKSMIVYSDGITEEEWNDFDGDVKKLLIDQNILDTLIKEIQSKKTEDDTTCIKLTYVGEEE